MPPAPSCPAQPARGPRPSVLIVDANPTIRWGLQRLFDSSPDVATVQACADTLERALLRAYARPDLIVIDIDIGGYSAIEIFPELRARSGATLIVYTRHDDERLLRDATMLGAVAIVSKDGPGAQLLAAVDRVARAHGPHAAPADPCIARADDARPPETQACAPGRPAGRAGTAAAAYALSCLTNAERAALRMLAAQRLADGAPPLLLDQVPRLATLESLYTKLDAGHRAELTGLLDTMDVHGAWRPWQA